MRASVTLFLVAFLESLGQATARFPQLGFPQIKHIVTFGDSYTDEGRLLYIIQNGKLPPPGYVPPISNSTFDGGYTWARIFANNTGITLHDYAVGGAACSNELTPQYFTYIGDNFPSVKEYEIPAFFTDFQLGTGSGKTVLNPAETLFTIWIGTNDIGAGRLLTGNQKPGVTLSNITSCAVDLISTLYKAGARNFIFQNIVPLQLAPLYASRARSGVTIPNHYFPNKNTFLSGDLDAISEAMCQLVSNANNFYAQRLPALALSLPGAKIAYFSSHDLFLDVINFPRLYLTAPYNTTGYEYHCNVANNCNTSYIYDGAHSNGYVWYDELHPSQNTERIFANEIIKTLSKTSKYATYYF